MNTISIPNMYPIYCERLSQAVRVMEQLSPEQRANFDIEIVARRTERGICACIAGFCGLDPWFQERGFITYVDCQDVSMTFREFFGTADPFLPTRYEQPSSQVTVEDAISALKRSIAIFSEAGAGAANASD